MLPRKFKRPLINVAKVKRVPRPVAAAADVEPTEQDAEQAKDVPDVQIENVTTPTDSETPIVPSEPVQQQSEIITQTAEVVAIERPHATSAQEFKVPPTTASHHDDVLNSSDIEENVIQRDLQCTNLVLPTTPVKNVNSPQRLNAAGSDQPALNGLSQQLDNRTSTPLFSPAKRRRTISNSSNGEFSPFRRRERTISNSSVASLSHHYAQPTCLNRVRTESVSSVVSDCTSPNTKNRMAEDHRLLIKKDFETRFKNGTPEKSAFKMYDLIYYNPDTEPMARNFSNTFLKPETIEPPVTKVEKRETDLPILAPKLKLNANGDLVIDNESLLIESSDDIKARESMKNSSILLLDSTIGMNGFYSRAKRPKPWHTDETLRFYKCLQIVGPDFSMMEHLFPKRSRHDIKAKYKREERLNPNLIDMAVFNHKEFKITDLKASLEAEDRHKEALAAEMHDFKSLKKSIPNTKKKGSRMKRFLEGNSDIYELEHTYKPRFRSRVTSKKPALTTEETDSQQLLSDDETVSSPTASISLPPFSSIKPEARVKAECSRESSNEIDTVQVLEKELDELLSPPSLHNSHEDEVPTDLSNHNRNTADEGYPTADLINSVLYTDEDIDINELMPSSSVTGSNKAHLAIAEDYHSSPDNRRNDMEHADDDYNGEIDAHQEVQSDTNFSMPHDDDQAICSQRFYKLLSALSEYDNEQNDVPQVADEQVNNQLERQRSQSQSPCPKEEGEETLCSQAVEYHDNQSQCESQHSPISTFQLDQEFIELMQDETTKDSCSRESFFTRSESPSENNYESPSEAETGQENAIQSTQGLIDLESTSKAQNKRAAVMDLSCHARKSFDINENGEIAQALDYSSKQPNRSNFDDIFVSIEGSIPCSPKKLAEAENNMCEVLDIPESASPVIEKSESQGVGIYNKATNTFSWLSLPVSQPSALHRAKCSLPSTSVPEHPVINFIRPDAISSANSDNADNTYEYNEACPNEANQLIVYAEATVSDSILLANRSKYSAQLSTAMVENNYPCEDSPWNAEENHAYSEASESDCRRDINVSFPTIDDSSEPRSKSLRNNSVENKWPVVEITADVEADYNEFLSYVEADYDPSFVPTFDQNSKHSVQSENSTTIEDNIPLKEIHASVEEYHSAEVGINLYAESANDPSDEKLNAALAEIEKGVLVLVSTPDPDNPDHEIHAIYVRDPITGERHETPLDVPDDVVQEIVRLADEVQADEEEEDSL